MMLWLAVSYDHAGSKLSGSPIVAYTNVSGLFTAAEAASPPGDPTGLDAASTVLSRYPAGRVPVEPVISAKTGDSAKSVKLMLKTEPGIAFSGPILISGRSQSEPEVTRQALVPLPAFGTLSGHLWLTVIPAPPK